MRRAASGAAYLPPQAATRTPKNKPLQSGSEGDRALDSPFLIQTGEADASFL